MKPQSECAETVPINKVLLACGAQEADGMDGSPRGGCTRDFGGLFRTTAKCENTTCGFIDYRRL